jgi:23S rRNA (cytidine1920-2'-O)/16S rRNA (cytidine1409-2'-O)-methyltransferase
MRARPRRAVRDAPHQGERADLALVRRGLFDSRAQAQAAIEAGLVTVNGVALAKPSQTIRPGDVVTAERPHPYVSRGGVKLAAALDAFGLDPAGLACLDCGASTGGFTDVLLRRGARHVLAVDTGRGQLHHSLSDHPRVTLLEATDIRSLDRAVLAEPPGFVVCDVSFISLSLVLPALTRLAAEQATLVALIKPQFEVGRAALGKGGLVRDAEAAAQAVARVRNEAVALGWQVIGLIDSPITGGDGNTEHLIAARR